MDSLSVIILNYNTCELTLQCLHSVYQSIRKELEVQVIVVDNGSTEPCQAALTNQFKDVLFLRSEQNLGFAKGNNLGLKYATGKYILLLNSDTIITDPDTFTKTIERVKQFDNNVVLSTQLKNPDGRVQVAYGPLPGLWIELIQTSFVYKLLSRRKMEKLLLMFVPDENRLITSGYIAATYLLFHRHCLDILPDKKLYDGTFLYGEELFWAADWLKQGISMYYCADVSIVHLVGQSLKGEDKGTRLRRTHQMEGERLFISREYSALKVFCLYILRLIRLALLAPFDPDMRQRLSILTRDQFSFRSAPRKLPN